jgi:3-hydroxypropanoate dehydrogenase
MTPTHTTPLTTGLTGTATATMTGVGTASTAGHLAIDDTTADLLFRKARTAMRFADAPVTDDQVAALYDLVKWGPSLMNAQPLRLVVIRSDDARHRLMGHLAEGNRPKTASAPLVVVLAADTAFHDHLPTVFPHNPAAAEAFAADDDRRERVALDQAWLQAGYVIVGVRALGLAAGPMAGFDAAALDADLLAGTTLRSFLVVNIGHPAEGAWHPRLPRLDPAAAVVTL